MFALRRDKDDDDRSDEFEFWIMDATKAEVAKIKKAFKIPIEEHIDGKLLEASVGVTASTDNIAGQILKYVRKKVYKKLYPDVPLDKILRENLLDRLDWETDVDAKNLSPNELAILKYAEELLRADLTESIQKGEPLKLTVSKAKLKAEIAIKNETIKNLGTKIAGLQVKGEAKKKTKYSDEVNRYMAKGHPEQSARDLVARDHAHEHIRKAPRINNDSRRFSRCDPTGT